jgi:DNA-binding response OmpR family regulator
VSERVPQPTAPERNRPAGRFGRALVVEDERDIAALLRHNLEKEGWEVIAAANGPDALRSAREHHPDVVLLDLMIPQLDGWEVCRQLKRDPATREVPVIIVTGRVDENDKIRGFDLGADDYIIKPFWPRELIARLRAVVRRGRADARKARLTAGDLEIDRDRFEVRMQGRPVELTPKEFELLATLVGAPGRVFGREALLDHVWGRDSFVEPRTVDVHVARLRARFTAAGLTAPLIEAVRGVGYRFRDPTDVC